MAQILEEAAKLERLLRRTQAAAYVTETYGIPCSPKTLAKLACVSTSGPPFRLAGRFPLYPTSGLDTWAQKQDRTARPFDVGSASRRVNHSPRQQKARCTRPAKNGCNRAIERIFDVYLCTPPPPTLQ